MKKKIVSGLSVAFALVVPALVLAQVARFSENEPLTVARMDQLVDAINGVNHGTPVELPAAVGDAAGGTTTRVYTARSAGTLLFVPGGAGFGQIEARITTATTTEASVTIARSLDGDTLTVPIGAGQSVTLAFTNGDGETPRMNTYFTSLTGGAPPAVSE